jgi:hypothetical protein
LQKNGALNYEKDNYLQINMKENNGEIKIEISKTKAILQTTIVIGLLGVTLWFLTKVILLNSASNKTFLLICCSLLIITFGLSCISGIRKLINYKQGIVINNKGIEINIGPNSGQFINWNEITELKIHNPVRGPMFLLIFIQNPDMLLSKTTGLKRFLLKINNVSHKTPVSLTSNWLECDFETLEELMTDGFEKYGAQRKRSAQPGRSFLSGQAGGMVR